MTEIRFKNVERSELLEEEISSRISQLIDKFPALSRARFVVTVEMDNSPTQAGKDVFHIDVRAQGGSMPGLNARKSSISPYSALGHIMALLPSLIVRNQDKGRKTQRFKQRQMKQAGIGRSDGAA